MRYSRLSGAFERRLFDPSKREDVLELKHYVEHNKWNSFCPFFVEYPWEDVPTMCKDKFAAYQLSKVD